MNKIFISIFILPFLITSCQQGKEKQIIVEKSEETEPDSITTIAFYYFHGSRRCPTCIKVGEITKATLEKNFTNEIKEGKIQFYDINIEDANYKDLVEKFQVNWNALIINTKGEKGEKAENLTEMAFRYANTSPDELEAAIKSRLYKFLNQ